MRRPVLPLVALVLALLAARNAIAVELPFTGTLTFKAFANNDIPAFEVFSSGVADAILDADDALMGLVVPPSVFSVAGQLVPVTDTGAFPIAGLIATMANDAGAFAAGQPGFGGTMPLQGTVKVCLFGTCSVAVANVTVPLSVVGRNATAGFSGAVVITVYGAPWTTGPAEFPVRGTRTPDVVGSRQTGALNLVTPVFISTNIAASPVVNSFARFVALFEPPGGGELCNNGVDDDADGFTDYPADPGCDSPEDSSERTATLPCDDGVDNDGDHRIDAHDPGCDGPLDGSERSATLVCDDGFDNDADGVTDFPSDTGCTSPADASEKGDRDCDDGIDDDGDGLVDYPADPGCSSASDLSERGFGRACDDGIDDDADGVADFPGDAGCASIDDPSEHSAAFVCDDGLDQDGDGRSDFPSDPGCATALDTSEHSASLPCDDALDNDFDGTKDYPGDPGCYGPSDGTELSSLACDDGLDDDGDGLIDSQQDPGCSGPADPRESLDFTDGLSHQIGAGYPSLDNAVYLGSGAGGAPTHLWLWSGGAIANDLRVDGTGSLDMSGGSIGGDLVAIDQADVTIRGGSIGGLLEVNDTAQVEIVGHDFDLPFGDVLAESGTITGFLRDGSAISLPFTRALGATIRLVPEPGAAAAALTALATLLVARARRRGNEP